MPKKKIFQELVFKKKYKSYANFHVENKEVIYKTIINLFKEFTITKNRVSSMIINANIENIEWSTELTFNKNEFYILKKDIMPHFEDIEDYETCGEILNISKSLTF